jgi:DNA-binding transcriptional regulator YiaG
MPKRRVVWDAGRVRALRGQLGLSQQAMADELGVRQATVSDWERGLYAPRGASARMLLHLAEQAGVTYRAPDDPAAP